MTDLHKQYETMLEVIRSDRTLVFPPPVKEPDKLTERLNTIDLGDFPVNGRKLLKYFVSLYGKDLTKQTIASVVEHLWVNASPQEKTEYVLLASSVNSINIKTSEADLTTAKADSPVKSFVDIGYFNLNDVISWWEEEKEFYEEDSYDDIMLSFFKEKFGNVKDFMDIVDDKYFSKQTKIALLDFYNNFLPIFYDYTPWEWFSWYIRMECKSTSTPAPCPFNSVKTKLPKNLQHFYYQGTISKQIKDEELKQLREFINLIMEIKHPGQDDSKISYHGTTSVAASNIARRIDLTVCSHFNHAFGFHRSFYIGDNLKFCLIWALKKAMTLRTVNCALVVFCINEGELHLIQDYLKLISNEDSQGHVNTGNIWEEIVPASKDSDENSNLDDDPIRPNVQWVEGPSLKQIENSWVPKKEEIIRSFRTDKSTKFLQSQLAFIITFKNPMVN
ncbi:hypothetical protein RhiirC2_711008 [Rhizophagus irregularis]|uniref:Uncharacterized protein n=1 Tax=Rhizophagus irregularis TaxID=588596 RepID=A0A2N1NCG1_9GLOM|nr:hypothetical protein RhiirC2_711008 [Rhizophagus irregularis]